MKNKLHITLIAIALMTLPNVNFGQVILGPDASGFVLFTTTGAIDDNASAHSHITGNVGTNTAAGITDFGNIDGVMHPGADATTALVDADLLSTIAQINALPATLVGPLALGSGGSITPGVWSIPGNATLTLDLFIDAQNDPNAEFIIKVAGTFSTNTLSRIKLINGAKACNVFWKIDGAITMASLSTVRGNFISGGAILMGSGDILEGRMFSTPAGAITIDNITARLPIGCNSPVLSGPNTPNLGSLECYTIFTSNGALDGNLSTTSIGDVGNAGGGTITGWTAGNVTGTLHTTGDPSTMLAATDLTNLYNTLNAMPYDIELEFPVLLGSDLVLTPHVYLINSSVNGPATLTDTIILDAQDNPNAVFVFKIINGAFTTSVSSSVKLINGAQAKNVFWMVDGAMSVNNNSIFRGTIVISSGALNLVNTGVTLEGRAFTQVGAITTAGLAATMTPGCVGFDIVTYPNDTTVCEGSDAGFSVTATNATGYQWMEDTGSGFINLTNSFPYSGVNSSDITISPVTATMNNYKYQCIVTGASGDIYSNFAALTVNQGASITAITQDSVCGPDTVVLGASASAGTIDWYANPTGGLSLDTGTTYTTPLISVTDTFYVETLFGSCSSFPRTMVIATIYPTYTINNPQTICDGDSFVFNGNTYTMTGNYNDTLSSINGCDSIIVTQLSFSTRPTAIASSNSPVCIDSSINLTAQTLFGTTYSWTGPNGFSSANQNPILTSATAAAAGIYTLTISNGGCSSIPATVSVTINNCDIATDLDIDKTVDNVYPVIESNVVFTITATNNGPINATGVIVTDILQSGYTYVSSIGSAGTYNSATGDWVLGNLNNGANEILTITATVNSSGIYINTAMISGNEVDENSINDVSVVETFPRDFFIPEGYSPNGDGINDVFVITGIQYYPKNSFVIFNRWGNKVFETNAYENTWNGKATLGITVGGDELPIGTYFYLLDLGDGSDVYKGTIYLSR